MTAGPRPAAAAGLAPAPGWGHASTSRVGAGWFAWCVDVASMTWRTVRARDCRAIGAVLTLVRLPEGAPGAAIKVPEAAAAPGGNTTTDEMEETLVNHEPSRTTTTTM